MVSAKINNLRSFKKEHFEIIKELSLLGAHMLMETNKELTEKQEEALFSLISRCGNEIINDDGELDYNYNIDIKIIEQYNEIAFWRELAKKMAARDTLEALGEEINENNFSKFEEYKNKCERMYIEKFKLTESYLNLKNKKYGVNFDNKFLPY